MNIVVTGLAITPDLKSLVECPAWLDQCEDPANCEGHDCCELGSLKQTVTDAMGLPWELRGSGPHYEFKRGKTREENRRKQDHLLGYVMRHPAWGDPEAGPPDPAQMVREYHPRQRWGCRGGALSQGGKGAARRAAWRRLIADMCPRDPRVDPAADYCACGAVRRHWGAAGTIVARIDLQGRISLETGGMYSWRIDSTGDLHRAEVGLGPRAPPVIGSGGEWIQPRDDMTPEELRRGRQAEVRRSIASARAELGPLHPPPPDPQLRLFAPGTARREDE
jgi:hypothetical protein